MPFIQPSSIDGPKNLPFQYFISFTLIPFVA